MKKILALMAFVGALLAIETNNIYYLKQYNEDVTRRAQSNDSLLRTFEIKGFGEILFFQYRIEIHTNAQLLNNGKDGKRVILEFKGERLFSEKMYKIEHSGVRRLAFLNDENFCRMIFLFDNDDYKDVIPTNAGYTIFLTE